MGDRTVGVLTKLDLVGTGGEDEVVQVLENVRKPLKLGYVGVKCRSQAGLKDNQSLEEARDEEAVFFRTHPVFRQLSPDVYGVETLTKKLTRVLVSRIQAAAPTMAADVATQLKDTDVALKGLGGAPPTTVEQRQGAYVQRVGAFFDVLRAAVRGQYDDPTVFSDASYRLCTAARKSLDACGRRIAVDLRPPFGDEAYLTGIKQRVEESRGRELACFPSVTVFNAIVKDAVAEWAQPAATCREAVVDALRAVVRRLAERNCGKYPALTAHVVGLAMEVVDDVAGTCAAALDQLLVYEGMPLTMNPAFMAAVSERRKTFFDRLAKSIADHTKASVQSNYQPNLDMKHYDLSLPVVAPKTILTAVEAYWQVASLRFVDNVASAVQHMLEAGAARLRTMLYTSLADADLEALFAEDGGLRAHRMALEAKRSRLREAQVVMRKLNGA
eukprot:TRINITY_DN5050_c0_g1_i1.p2 TRINITY_DN5050_c0_g1~~TRINITY_DN5050_c0_g1_i1.p2  ORF type:complete len:443 (+),score=161.34 TRINITY_DN5050_c0_g1_i1:363-1691(+)